MVEFCQHSASSALRLTGRSLTAFRGRAWKAGAYLALVLAFGFSAVALCGEGYQPYRNSNRFSQADRFESGTDGDEGRAQIDPPARRYAPYPQRQRPVENIPSTDDTSNLNSNLRRAPQLIRPEPAEGEENAPNLQGATWRAAPAKQNRRPTKPASAPVVDEEAEASAGLVSDDGGPIAEVLLHYAVNSEGELGAIYNDLFRHLGPNVRLQVCCSNQASVEAFSSRWGAAALGEGRQVQLIDVNRPITVWARDRRICRQTPDGRMAACFVPTAHFTYDPEKQNDLVLSSLLYPTGLAPSVSLASFHLEGGNVVSNRRHVFVGANAHEDNAHRFVSEAAMFAELTKIFGRPTIPIRAEDGDVPWIHTDMYLTPVDSRTILVSNPAEGCRLLEGQHTISVPHRDRQVQVEFDLVNEESERQIRFDQVAEQLTQLGYKVIRVPSLINVNKDWMVTYNNVLMDYQDGRRVVFMPIYHIPELDNAAAQIYRSLGFEVRAVDVSTIFQLGGAIRCLANVTRRLPFEARLQPQVAETPGRLQVYSVDPNVNRIREPRPRFERRPLPPALRERPQASIQRPADVAQ